MPPLIHQTRPGRASAGQPIGILLLDTSVPFIPGDVANASTYRFPVRYRKVDGFTVAQALGRDPSVYDALLDAAGDLVVQGCRAVTGDCGFMGLHQKRLAADLDAPVFLSSLLQIPFISLLLPDSARIGVITADAGGLTDELLAAVGVTDRSRLVLAGLENRPAFRRFAIEETGTLDEEAVRSEMIETASALVRRDPAVRALLLECSLLPPYAADVAQVTGLPVFDYITMINYVFEAVVKERFTGFM